MKRKSLFLALAASCLGTLVIPALAQDKSGINVDPAAAASTSGGAMTLVLARDLYALGLAQGDALTVLAAARLAASVQTRPAEPQELDPARIILADGDEEAFRKAPTPIAPAEPALIPEGAARPAARATFFTATSDDEGAADAPYTAETMFAAARDLAGEDELFLGLIDDAMAERPRGRIGGAASWQAHLPAGQTDVWEIPFEGSSFAEIAVIGDGDTNLDIAVTDENGNVFCFDVSGADSLYCDFTPAWNGYFYVSVQNLGRLRNSYSLITN